MLYDKSLDENNATVAAADDDDSDIDNLGKNDGNRDNCSSEVDGTGIPDF